MDEVRQWRDESADLLRQLTVDRKLRRDLAEALTRIYTAVPAGTVPGAHYALKDDMEVVSENQELDAEIAKREAARQGGEKADT